MRTFVRTLDIKGLNSQASVYRMDIWNYRGDKS